MIRKIRAAWRVVVEEKGKLINGPNGLTMLRVVSIPFICSYIQHGNIFWAAWLFILAAFTDYLDGKIARQSNQETKVGRFFDQAADKFFVLATLWFLPALGLQTWIVRVIFWREIIIGAGRALITDRALDAVMVTKKHGQIKAAAQYIGIAWTILRWPAFNWIMAVVAILTLVSGAIYVLAFLAALYKSYIKRLMLALKNNYKQ